MTARPAGTKANKITESCQAGGKTLELIADGRIGLHYSRLKEKEKGLQGALQDYPCLWREG